VAVPRAKPAVNSEILFSFLIIINTPYFLTDGQGATKAGEVGNSAIPLLFEFEEGREETDLVS
jgi:hypothetical protein